MSKLIPGTFAAILCLFGVVSAQQDPNDIGLQDSIFIEVSQSCAGEAELIAVDVYFFNDAQTVIAGSTVFDWDHPGLEFDSLISTPLADSVFDMVIGITASVANADHQQALGAFAFDTIALGAAPIARKIATYWFHMNDWQAGDTISFDTASRLNIRNAFLNTKQREYVVAWRGAVSIELQACEITAIHQPGDRLSLPGEFFLSHNYPNPFNPSTAIDYALPASSRIELAVFNQLGQKVAVLIDGVQSAGPHTAYWNGRDDEGRAVASGVYLYRLSAPSFTTSRKMLLLK